MYFISDICTIVSLMALPFELLKTEKHRNQSYLILTSSNIIEALLGFCFWKRLTRSFYRTTSMKILQTPADQDESEHLSRGRTSPVQPKPRRAKSFSAKATKAAGKAFALLIEIMPTE